MQSLTVNLNSIEKVRKFVTVLYGIESDFDLASDRYVIDAKSIMGIFSLDLSKDLRLDIYNDDMVEKATELLAPFIV